MESPGRQNLEVPQHCRFLPRGHHRRRALPLAYPPLIQPQLALKLGPFAGSIIATDHRPSFFQV